MTLDPDCVSVRIDKSTASANRSPKIMLVVRSELNSAVWTQMKSRAWQTCWVTVWLTSLSSTFWAYLLLSCSVSQSLPPSLAFILKKQKQEEYCGAEIYFELQRNKILTWNFVVFPRAPCHSMRTDAVKEI